MDIELRTFSELSDTEQVKFASQIAAETQAKFMAEQKIVPVEPEAILQREIGLLALHNGRLAGYVGATNVDAAYTQVGTLIVLEYNQGSGTGKQLVVGITELVVGEERLPFAFSNPNSQPSFEFAGYTPAKPRELPPKAQSQFNNQPMIHLGASSNRQVQKLVGASVLAQ